MIKNNDIKMLSEALVKIKNEDEMSALLEDLCTMGELISISQRLKVACLLSEGKSYNDVKEETGVSSATISRVSTNLNYGNGGYKFAINALGEEKQC